jgi:hypothetical protein
MARIARLSTLYASFLFLAALSIGGAYYLYFSPMLPSPEKQAAIERFIKDPGANVEQLRKAALGSHEVVIAAHKAMDAAILMIVTLCGIAAVGFVSIAITARKTKADAPSAL